MRISDRSITQLGEMVLLERRTMSRASDGLDRLVPLVLKRGEKRCPSSRDGVGEGKKVTLSSVLGKRKQRRSPIDACVVGVGGRGI